MLMTKIVAQVDGDSYSFRYVDTVSAGKCVTNFLRLFHLVRR